MENASKALLIASAVLIGLLLVAFAMRVFTSSGESAGTVENTTKTVSNETEVATEYTVNSISNILGIH